MEGNSFSVLYLNRHLHWYELLTESDSAFQKKARIGSENRFSVHGLNSPLIVFKGSEN